MQVGVGQVIITESFCIFRYYLVGDAGYLHINNEAGHQPTIPLKLLFN